MKLLTCILVLLQAIRPLIMGTWELPLSTQRSWNITSPQPTCHHLLSNLPSDRWWRTCLRYRCISGRSFGGTLWCSGYHCPKDCTIWKEKSCSQVKKDGSLQLIEKDIHFYMHLPVIKYRKKQNENSVWVSLLLFQICAPYPELYIYHNSFPDPRW